MSPLDRPVDSGGEADRVAPRPRGREWPFALVLLLAVAGVLVIAFLDRFRRGSVLFATAFMLGSVLRLVLPARSAGLLAVRSKTFDVFAFAALGVAIAVLAVVTPAASPAG